MWWITRFEPGISQSLDALTTYLPGCIVHHLGKEEALGVLLVRVDNQAVVVDNQLVVVDNQLVVVDNQLVVDRLDLAVNNQAVGLDMLHLVLDMLLHVKEFLNSNFTNCENLIINGSPPAPFIRCRYSS